MKWLLALVVVGLLVGGAIYSGLTAATTVDAARPQTTDIREFVDEQAVTRLPLTHLITMPYDGRILAIRFAEGERVARGQQVAEIAPVDLTLKVNEAKANIDELEASIVENSDTSVEYLTYKQSLSYVESMDSTVKAAQARVDSGIAKLDFANKDLSRVRSLHERNNASVEQLQAAELRQVEAEVDLRQDQLILKSLQSIAAATALLPQVVSEYMGRKGKTADVFRKRKETAQIRLEQAKRDDELGKMESPIDGVVLERLETNERRVAPGTVLMKIGNPDDLEIEVDVLSQDVVRVKPGDKVEIYGPAVGPKGAAGTVARIYPAGFTKVSSLGVEQQRVKVIVQLANGELPRLRRDHDLGVGYRVRVRIVTDEKSQALTVPRSALFRGPAGGWQLFAIREGRARLTDVTVGLMNDEQVEIVGGVTADEQVVLAPESTLVDGTRVRAAADRTE